MNQPKVPRKGESVELHIDSAAYEGLAVGRLEGFVVFVRNAVPGDRVRARIRRKRRNFAEASLEEIIEPSPHRVEPRCRYFGICGGCRWQNLDYEQQLAEKRDQVRELLSRIGGLETVEVRPTLASPQTYDYRNKMEFTFGVSRWLTREEIAGGVDLKKDFALGLHIPKRYDKILDLQVCHLQGPTSAEIVNRVRDVAVSQGWNAYDSRQQRGYLRNLVIRTSQVGGEIMVVVVTFRHDHARMTLLAEALLEEFPQISTLINSINGTPSPVAAGREILYHGPGTITEKMDSLTFTIAATTFFQPNTLQAQRLYQTAVDLAELRGTETVYDLYSGIGCIALFLSFAAARVIGVEQYQKAVEDATRNAAANGIRNCTFLAADAAAALQPASLKKLGFPDIVVADPPRVGLSKALLQSLLQVLPEKIVYISCNPATQARDVNVLRDHYQIQAIQPVDMFPHSHHIENVVSLKRTK